MKGDKWRDMRTTLSPAFTGSKMRHMLPFIAEISSRIMGYLKDTATDEIEVENLMRRYTNDVIASVAYGLQIDSLKDPKNEFYEIGNSIFSFTTLQKLHLFMFALFPSLTKKLGIQLYPQKTRHFFRNILVNTVEYRKNNNVVRPDLIQLLMDASTGTLKNTDTVEDDVGFATVQEGLKPQANIKQWTLDDLMGQVYIFFLAGYETTATGLVMCIHELALNPDIEERLYQEIRAFKERNGNLTYENVNELKYLDCVLNESLRRWPEATFLDRQCTKPYELPPPREGGKTFNLKPGDTVLLMVNSIHLDPKYYPNPEKFDPERFSDDNKQNIKPFTFMPFGSGPRNCIGSRLAILQIKLFLYNLILNFKILKCPKTTDPIEIEPKSVPLKTKDSSWVKLQARN